MVDKPWLFPDDQGVSPTKFLNRVFTHAVLASMPRERTVDLTGVRSRAQWPKRFLRLLTFDQKPIPKHLRVRFNEYAFRLKLNINDFTQYYYYNNLFDRDDYSLIAFLTQHADPEGVFLDVGANIGLYSLLASPFFGQIYSFEPHPRTAEILTHNISENAVKNVQHVAFALSENSGQAYIQTDLSNSGNNAVTAQSASAEFQIHMISLDDFVDQNKVTNIKLIKIDIEGHELPMLRGAKKTLEKWAPKLFVETHSKSDYQRILDVLPSGYRGLNPYTGQPIGSADLTSWTLENVVFEQ